MRRVRAEVELDGVTYVVWARVDESGPGDGVGLEDVEVADADETPLSRAEQERIELAHGSAVYDALARASLEWPD